MPGNRVLDRPDLNLDPAYRRLAWAARRVAYAMAAVVNVVLWYAVAVWPGWQELPFLTTTFTTVLPFVIAFFAVNVGANVIWLSYDPPWAQAAGRLVSRLTGAALVVQLWQVFPFELDDTTVPWTLLVQILLGLAMAGSAVGVLGSLFQLGAALSTPDRRAR
jgi:hypothetical protein